MSLIGGLHISFAGLRATESQLSTASANVTNANKPGYTRKEYESTYTTSNLGSVPTGGSIKSVLLDPVLQESVIEDTSIAAADSVAADYLAEYADRLGSTTGGNTLSASLDDLAASLDTLAVTPEDDALKAGVVSDADNLAFQLRELSDSVQDLRARADKEIEQTVADINQSIEKISEINVLITESAATGISTADLEDERRAELETLASYIDIDYFTDNDNQVRIYTGNRALLTSVVHTLSYTASTAVVGSHVYPGGFSDLTVAGADITTSVTGGKIGGLIELRDTTLVEEQDKLDEFATVLSDELNAILNQGASIPPRDTIVGDTQGFAAGTAFAGTGFVRIAITDQSGTVVNFNDFDLSLYATVGDVVTAINGALGADITASITADGELSLVANNANEGVSLNELTSSVGGGGDGFSDFFGLNNLFDATGAEDIQVSEYLRNNSDYLATGPLSSSGALAVGDVGVNPGDGSIAKSLNDAFETLYSFNAAGNFAAQSETLDNYADKIMADVAARANAADEDAETTQFLLDQTKTTLQNLTGVNIDEEMVHLLEIEARYNASATLIATIQDMFDELLGAVR